MHRRTRRVAVVAAIAGACVVPGCSGDEPDQPVTEQSVDEVASSWGEISARDEERTQTYLTGPGAPLKEYAEFAAELPVRLDDAAYDDGCADLEAELAGYPRRDVVDWLYGLPDPILGRLWTSQIPTLEVALDECATGDREASEVAAEKVSGIQDLIDRRLDQLAAYR